MQKERMLRHLKPASFERKSFHGCAVLDHIRATLVADLVLHLHVQQRKVAVRSG
jgi:hypothetical protein